MQSQIEKQDSLIRELALYKRVVSEEIPLLKDALLATSLYEGQHIESTIQRKFDVVVDHLERVISKLTALPGQKRT